MSESDAAWESTITTMRENLHEITIREKVRPREVVMDLAGRSETLYIYGWFISKKVTLKTM